MEAGGHGLLTFRRQDLIVVSPGVPLDTPELAQARNFGLPVIGELELAARFLKGKILAITGSNGKTTTTSLLGEILKAAGIAHAGRRQHRRPGRCARSTRAADDTLDLCSKSQASSWNRPSSSIPAIAVILNITPDHLDRHGNFENYALAKERIFAEQTEQDLCCSERRQRACSRFCPALSCKGLLVLARAPGRAGRMG